MTIKKYFHKINPLPLLKKNSRTSFFSLFLLIGGLITFFTFHTIDTIKSATYGWTQSSWLGGQTSNTATHTNNQDNWTEYTSKDANIVADENGVTIAGTANTWVETSNADFNAGTRSSIFTSSNAIYAQKPFGASCTTNDQCRNGTDAGYLGGFCSGGVCTNPWISGPCAGILVHARSLGSYQWKTTQTNCDTPQCGLDGGQNNDNLVADNSVDFSLYPARNVCKNAGGRLPTLSELQCIYTNKSAYEGYEVFGSSSYWSATENNTTNAWGVRMSDGNTSNGSKALSHSVRCVRGQ